MCRADLALIFFYRGCTHVVSTATATAVWGQGSAGTSFTSSATGLSSTTINGPTYAYPDMANGLLVIDDVNVRILYFPTNSFTATQVWGLGPPGNNFTSSGAGGTTSTTFDTATALLRDAAGGLYVADSLNNRVLYFPSSSYVATKVWGQGAAGNDFVSSTSALSATALNGPGGLALDSTGGLYVSDTGNGRVVYFPPGSYTATRAWGINASGTTLTSGGSGVSAVGLTSPKGIRVDLYGGLYVTDQARIVYYAPGSFTATKVWGQGSGGNSFTTNSASVSPTGLTNALDLALDDLGGLYAVDATANRVIYFPPQSFTATTVWGQGASGTSLTTNAS
ncbi:MAG TPA: NHL repeat-containing protein, partial [Leptospiraceae bacterium]|nr:NHL repeat-containing protein [Leptospiraceae bacterium]